MPSLTRTQGPVSTGPCALPSASGQARRARRSPLGADAGGRGEDRGDHPAAAVHHRAARVAVAHEPAQRGDRAPDRAAAVCVLGVRGHGRRPRRAGWTSYPPFSGNPRIAAEVPESGSASIGSAGAPDDARGAEEREVVLDVEPDDVGVVPRPVALELDGRVVLAGDHVRVGHDHGVAARPSPSPARRGRTPCRARARRCRSPPGPRDRARSSRSGGRTSGAGP